MQALTLEKTTARDFTLVILASFLISLFGQLSIPLWFSPVPIATQSAAVLLVAALLGSRRGAAATFAFLAQGALGLPVFSGGVGGIQCFFGPTGGYLIGYLIASYVVGYLIETYKRPFTALSVGNLVIYFFGASYLATFVGFGQALLLGVAPFVLGDLLKMIVSLKLLQKLKTIK
ncbi:MAG: biotin transporter BioY [Chlamydiae bacterium CG10_big_fil_rev_8_21_14_0_10_42_34]|nr:MAG: biotin transporter BioY [Chlamydiae bacterium CG10_big_fil_rev_8_21_14_0_10_42_34]